MGRVDSVGYWLGLVLGGWSPGLLWFSPCVWVGVGITLVERSFKFG